ncbi:D-tyrosyl-tRNA deacylase [Raphidocelis subcapitata]|uniref:D-aminoacyl-tRNA deacylase n=1 Tax=Raphidocelis subcapitata TaxID=307507 RepID=A0A2V0NMS4_9CHLO|nr:D-tyrosyl-tRNA deacylase [Raphidocelis subcapitata]|eukprot:GBF88831.1 D-tyrosyl-tRNA deacylase [Raphidocelis subcapitata]
MRCVLQRVLSASVEVDGETVGAIGPGLLCLVGIAADDTDRDAEWLARKLLRCRAFGGAEGKPWELDVASAGYEILCVSQFTLHARFKKPRPDFSKAMGPGGARPFYEAFLERLRAGYEPGKVKDGRFGAMMKVELINDGPVTFVFDSRAPDGGSGSTSSLSTADDG